MSSAANAQSAQGGRRLRLPAFGVGPQLIALLLVLGLLGAMAIEPTRQLIEQRRRIAGMTEELEDIRRSNRKLDARIGRLNDPDFLEQRARDIGLVRAGETAYVVMPPSRSKVRARRARAPKPVPAPLQPSFFEGFLSFVGLR